MEHIFQIGINVDDEVIKRRIEDWAEKEVIEYLKNEVANHIFDIRWGGSTRRADLSEFAKDIIRECFEDNKERIIKEAAEHLADRFARTKMAKEYLVDALKDSK